MPVNVAMSQRICRMMLKLERYAAGTDQYRVKFNKADARATFEGVGDGEAPGESDAVGVLEMDAVLVSENDGVFETVTDADAETVRDAFVDADIVDDSAADGLTPLTVGFDETTLKDVAEGDDVRDGVIAPEAETDSHFETVLEAVVDADLDGDGVALDNREEETDVELHIDADIVPVREGEPLVERVRVTPALADNDGDLV